MAVERWLMCCEQGAAEEEKRKRRKLFGGKTGLRLNLTSKKTAAVTQISSDSRRPLELSSLSHLFSHTRSHNHSHVHTRTRPPLRRDPTCTLAFTKCDVTVPLSRQPEGASMKVAGEDVQEGAETVGCQLELSA